MSSYYELSQARKKERKKRRKKGNSKTYSSDTSPPHCPLPLHPHSPTPPPPKLLSTFLPTPALESRLMCTALRFLLLLLLLHLFHDWLKHCGCSPYCLCPSVCLCVCECVCVCVITLLPLPLRDAVRLLVNVISTCDMTH